MISSSLSESESDHPPNCEEASVSSIMTNDEILTQLTDKFALTSLELSEIHHVIDTYPMRISRHYFSLIKEKNDPIWRQCIPSCQELEDQVGEEDPLCEERDAPAPLITHRYPNRCLMLVSETCDMYCRFCTRKRKVGTERLVITFRKIDLAIAYIRDHSAIQDVILSGGDALCAPIARLEYILERLRQISHVKVIRLGTRLPCANPSRITQELCDRLKKYHPIFINVHFEHPSELTPEAMKACNMLADAGFPVGNQNVLLHNINDDPQTMRDLYMDLIECRVRPYYLFQADYVKGTNHFRTPVEIGLDIMDKVRGWISGLAVPQYVIDMPNGGGKTPLLPHYVDSITKDVVKVKNWHGDPYEYPQHR